MQHAHPQPSSLPAMISMRFTHSNNNAQFVYNCDCDKRDSLHDIKVHASKGTINEHHLSLSRTMYTRAYRNNAV